VTSPAARLARLLRSEQLTVLMGAHDGLSAKLAEEAGFEALWASGLSISSALGVRDSNEASWTQVLEVLEFMADATTLPILLDGDTGYGNFNNVRRLVRKLEQRGVAGLCLEDKLFPKTNSLLPGGRQQLTSIDEFRGKVRAAKDTQQDPDFVVVARTEAMIAGWGVDEALLRATAYAEAGADAILVHSARRDGSEVRAFARRWNRSEPLVVVPTAYPAEPLGEFVEAGVTNAIFANQSLRASITAMQGTLARLRETLDLSSVEADIAPMAEVFRLQDMAELSRSEQLYLPSDEPPPRPSVLILAATQGDLGDLVADRPKAMVELRGRPIIGWQLDSYRRQGLGRVAVVRGYAKEALAIPDVTLFDNDDHASTGELSSLLAAREYLVGPLVIAYGDIVFDDFILAALLAHGSPLAVPVDMGWALRQRDDHHRDLMVVAPDGDGDGLHRHHLVRLGSEAAGHEAVGEWVGLLATDADGTEALVGLLDRLAGTDPESLRSATIPDLLAALIGDGAHVDVIPTYGHWFDLDDHADLQQAAREVP